MRRSALALLGLLTILIAASGLTAQPHSAGTGRTVILADGPMGGPTPPTVL